MAGASVGENRDLDDWPPAGVKARAEGYLGMCDKKGHWENIYETKRTDQVSWFQQHAARSLRLIGGTGVAHAAQIIDVGGGASTLVDDLLLAGYSRLTVLDLSAAALAAAKARLGNRAAEVRWLEVDITRAVLPDRVFDLWHDRAVFHFLTNEDDRRAYVRNLLRAVKPGGYVIVATFAEDGPEKCSGLPVVRYSPDDLCREFGSEFSLEKHEREEHRTPFGTMQKFVYCCFRTTRS